MSQEMPKESKNQILAAFRQLLAQQQQIESRVATKEEEAEKETNQQLLEVAATYTVDSIVNGMAALQLNFGSAIGELSGRLATEAERLDELRRAIAVAKNNLEQQRKVRLVADALYILRQEHQEQLTTFTQRAEQQQEAIEKEMAQTHKWWEKEQAEFTARVAEMAQLQLKQREKKAEDRQYAVERDRKIEMDEYEEEKRLQERTLQNSNREKEKQWAEREQILSDNREEFEANQQRVEGFEEELKKAENDARGEAIKAAEREAKVKSDLFEKEWEASEQGYLLQITSLEAVIERQAIQIEELTAQLQAATNQAQQLAMRAFQSSSNTAA